MIDVIVKNEVPLSAFWVVGRPEQVDFNLDSEKDYRLTLIKNANNELMKQP